MPLTVDGLILPARWLLGLAIAATPAANVAHGLGHGLGHGLIGAAVAAWPAVALVGSYELLMLVIRGAQSPEAEAEAEPDADPIQARAEGEFADQIASGTVPSIRAIRARLHVGQPRAQQVRKYLAQTVRQTAA